jgi:flagellar protein FliT
MEMNRIYELTVALDQLVQMRNSMPRETFLEKLLRLLDARGKLIDGMSGKVSEEERPICRKVVLLNQRINPVLQDVKREIAADMNQFRVRKSTVSRYRNPYNGPTKDGMFLDKRE